MDDTSRFNWSGEIGKYFFQISTIPLQFDRDV